MRDLLSLTYFPSAFFPSAFFPSASFPRIAKKERARRPPTVCDQAARSSHAPQHGQA